jgi:hypothetical protein
MPTYENNNISLTRLSDGTIKYGFEVRSRTKVDIENLTKNYISGAIYSLENYSELSNDIINIFIYFLKRICENNTEIELLLMPYPETVYNYLILDEKYKIVSSVEEFIISFARENNIHIQGSYNPKFFNLKIDDFSDGMHLTDNGIMKILKKK